MKKKEKTTLIATFLIAVVIIFFFSLSNISVLAQELPTTPTTPIPAPTMPASPYILPNAGTDPWSQFSWQQDYCNKTGMDFLVLLDPTACSPAVVRSDLLEEQDVPVMCRLTGVKINPLIQVPYIKNIVVGVENKSKEVRFVNFWPARTALTYSHSPFGKVKEDFEGVPTMNNLGYLWIQLARQPVEAKMPDSVKVNLNAIITYDVARTYGVNEHQFALPVLSQEEWLSGYKGYSFWRGKGYVRLINITGKSSALLGIYINPRFAPQTVELREGQTSKEFLLPGFYCGAGVSVRLDEITTPENRARLLVNGNEELVGENEKILDSDCKVGTIEVSPGYGGKVLIVCRGKFKTLTIEDFGATLEIKDHTKNASKKGKREQRVIAGDKILLKGLKEKEKQEEYYLYAGWIGKQIGKEEKLIGNVLLFGRENGKAIGDKSVENIVSALHDYMKAHRGEALTIMQAPEKKLNADIKKYLRNMEIPGTENYVFYVWSKGFGKSFTEGHLFVEVIEIEGPEQASYSEEIEDAYKEAIDQWEAIAHEYSMKPSPEGMWYGVMALRRASELARDLHKRIDQAEFLKKLINKYAGSDEPEIIEEVDWAREELRRAVAGSGNRFVTLERPSGSYSIELLGIEKGGFAEYTILEVEEDGRKETGKYIEEDIIDNWEITEIDEYAIELRNLVNTTKKLTISKGAWARLNGTKVRVIDIVRTLEAKVTVLPFERDRKTEANFTVQIGIEKRAIQLSPAQTRDMIAKLNKTIAQLEKISGVLNTTITWWKKACFVGASALWIKNFITGVSGEALARKLVMENWGERCANPAYRKALMRKKDIKGYDISISRCYREHGDEIAQDVKTMKNAIDEANDFVKKVKEKPGVMTKSGFFGLSKVVDEAKFINASKAELEKEKLIIYEYKELYKLTDLEKKDLALADVEIINTEGEKEIRTVEEVLTNSELFKLNRKALVETGEFLESNATVVAKFDLLYGKGWLAKDDIKEIYLDIALYKECQNQSKTGDISPLCSSALKSTYEELSTYRTYVAREEELGKAKTLFEEIGIKPYIPSISLGAITVPAEIFILNKSKTKWLNNFFEADLLGELGQYAGKKAAFINPEGIFMLVILEPREENFYRIIQGGYIPLKRKDEGKYMRLEIPRGREEDLTLEQKALRRSIERVMNEIKEVQEADPSLYESPILRGLEPGESWNTIKFWERGPYEGKVAYMAIEKKSGWYFATKSYTGLEGALVAYKETGDVNAVWICNVGANGAPNFDFSRGNVGDDYCVEIVREVLPSLEVLNPTVRAAYEKALRCAAQAMREFAVGKKEITTKDCHRYRVGKPPVVRPTMQCEDFMSPSDCRIMYNLCDPVMCPASRCDFGGRMPVENVIQSGIIGSIMLCWPNFEGGHGVLVPICLTGVHAGIDTFITVLKSGRDCLQEQLETGRTVGICDQVMSLYICEFFWRQFDPFIRAGLPALTESLVGRGGGEYALFSESWKQSLEASRYFTSFYATESFKAFKARSTAEVGTEICKKFVGVAYPTQAKFWEELSRPESPSQAFATFQEIPLGGPSTDSQYKVYFHIYAGRDQGAYYSIWLRKPPVIGMIPTLPEFIVPRGFGYIPAGQYVSETPDFHAPSGYKEICIRINNEDFCGFQQAGTNFALEQMQNKYLEDQIKQNIRTAKECVSGTPTIFPSPAIVTNIQSAVEHALEPQIYRRGIVRVCASDNPGRGTQDEQLWKRIGDCDSKEVGCWLYQKSLNESISDLGIRADLYNYSEQEHINWAMTALGLEDPNVSRTQLNEKEQTLRRLEKNAEKLLSILRKEIEEQNLSKEDYIARIGYSEDEEKQEKICADIGILLKEFKAIKKRCAHPDEKVRADWGIAQLLSLKARLISLADVIIIEEKLKAAAEEVEVEKPLFKLFKTWPFEGAFDIFLDDNTLEFPFGSLKKAFAVAKGKVISVEEPSKVSREVTIETDNGIKIIYDGLRARDLKVTEGQEIKYEGEWLGVAINPPSLKIEVGGKLRNPLCFFDPSLKAEVELVEGRWPKWKECQQIFDELGVRTDISTEALKLPIVAGLFNSWPVENYEITSCYGFRTDPFTKGKKMHYGIDIGADKDTLVKAIADGRVFDVEKNCKVGDKGCGGGYGNFVLLRHNGIYTRYSHLNSVSEKVKKNALVYEGQEIGKVGSTGRSTGPHLDLRIHTTSLVEGVHPLCFFTYDVKKKLEFRPDLATNALKYSENRDEGFYSNNSCWPDEKLCINVMSGGGFEIKRELKKECDAYGTHARWYKNGAEECHKLDTCYWSKWIAASFCHSCTEAKKCGEFNDDKQQCENLDCLKIANGGKGLECEWLNGKCEKATTEKKLERELDDFYTTILKDGYVWKIPAKLTTEEVEKKEAILDLILESTNKKEEELKKAYPTEVETIEKKFKKWRTELEKSLNKIKNLLAGKGEEIKADKETEWKNFVRIEALRLVNKGHKADSADFAITLLYNYAKEFCVGKGLEPEITFYDEAGKPITSSDLESFKTINVKDLALQKNNAIERYDARKAKTARLTTFEPGDLLFYGPSENLEDLRIAVFLEKNQIGKVSGKEIYRYHLAYGAGEKTAVKDEWLVDHDISEDGTVIISDMPDEWRPYVNLTEEGRISIIQGKFKPDLEKEYKRVLYFFKEEFYSHKYWNLDLVGCVLT